MSHAQCNQYFKNLELLQMQHGAKRSNHLAVLELADMNMYAGVNNLGVACPGYSIGDTAIKRYDGIASADKLTVMLYNEGGETWQRGVGFKLFGCGKKRLLKFMNFTSDGNLIAIDTAGKICWHSGTSGPGVLAVQNSGVVAIFAPDGSVKWSFGTPKAGTTANVPVSMLLLSCNCALPTQAPTPQPITNPTPVPISLPTKEPSRSPVANPSQQPSFEPTSPPLVIKIPTNGIFVYML